MMVDTCAGLRLFRHITEITTYDEVNEEADFDEKVLVLGSVLSIGQE